MRDDELTELRALILEHCEIREEAEHFRADLANRHQARSGRGLGPVGNLVVHAFARSRKMLFHSPSTQGG
jgi:hypothetical protein